jgi:hypothetical protein
MARHANPLRIARSSHSYGLNQLSHHGRRQRKLTGRRQHGAGLDAVGHLARLASTTPIRWVELLAEKKGQAMSDETEAIANAKARWDQKAGPRVGDLCEPKTGILCRIAGVSSDGVKLTAFQSSFILDLDVGDVIYASGDILNHPPIPASSLRLKQDRRHGAMQVRSGSNRFNDTSISCRVFEEI